MTEGPWDGSDLPPQAVVPEQVPEHGAEAATGGGGGGGGDQPLDPRERAAHPRPDLHVDEWPDHGVKPALGGLTI